PHSPITVAGPQPILTAFPFIPDSLGAPRERFGCQRPLTGLNLTPSHNNVNGQPLGCQSSLKMSPFLPPLKCPLLVFVISSCFGSCHRRWPCPERSPASP